MVTVFMPIDAARFSHRMTHVMSALLDLLGKFSGAHGTSGYEADVRALVVREFKKWVDEINVTPLGSVIGIKRAKLARGTKRNGETPRVLVEAHMDEIGFIVTGIEDGFIRFNEIGSFDPRILLSQNVLIHGRKKVPGVIGARPPHVLTASEREKSIPLRELFIDVGMTDTRVRELVSVGDFVTMDRSLVALENDFVAGKAFDDRASLVALIEMLRQLQNVDHAWDVYAVANVNEEDSTVYVGALTSTFHIRPQLAICLDVTHAQQQGLNDEAAPHTAQGPGIARGANVHPLVWEKLREAAVRGGIPHQITVYGGDTQTNAWMMQVTGEGVPTGLVEIPLRYMHTPVETVQLDDVAHTAELLRVMIAGLTQDDAHALQGEKFVRVMPKGLTRLHSKRAPAQPGKLTTRKARAPLVGRTPKRAAKLKRKR